jgi:hypothetical protein
MKPSISVGEVVSFVMNTGLGGTERLALLSF